MAVVVATAACSARTGSNATSVASPNTVTLRPETPAPPKKTAVATPNATESASTHGTPSPDERQRSQAQAALDEWERVIGDSPPGAIVFTSGLTTLDHGWSGRGAGNNKSAMFAGFIEATVPIPTDVPDAGEVRWSNGARQPVDLISAAEALAEVVAEGDGSCADCTPVHVEATRLTTHRFDTSRGTAETPVWEFTLREDDVHVFHVAVANRIVHQPEATHADIFAARGHPDSKELTVSFIGSKCCAEQVCGADYTGEPVVSDLAVVVMIFGHSSSGYSGPCTAEGYTRSVTVTLTQPLGDRTVLDIFGAPVPLCGPKDERERSMCLYSDE